MGTLEQYAFKVRFLTEPDRYYLRVPLMTFAVDGVKNDQEICTLLVQNINVNSTLGLESIVFGGMFFEEFYGLFKNKYYSFSDEQ